MNVYDIRRINLLKLMTSWPSQKKFAESVDTAPAYIIQIVSKLPRTSGKSAEIGNALARKIEKKLELESGWMDVNHQVNTINLSSNSPDDKLNSCHSFLRLPTANDFSYVPVIAAVEVVKDGFLEPTGKSAQMVQGWVRGYAQDDASAYGVRLLDNCLYPVVRAGWILVFNPKTPLMPLSFIHITLKDGQQIIKELIALRDGLLHLQSINSNQRLTVSIENILSMAMCVRIVMSHECLSEHPGAGSNKHSSF